MIIRADEEGKQVVIQLCDLALKQTGIQNVQGIVKIMAAVEEITEEPPADKQEDV